MSPPSMAWWSWRNQQVESRDLWRSPSYLLVTRSMLGSICWTRQSLIGLSFGQHPLRKRFSQISQRRKSSLRWSCPGSGWTLASPGTTSLGWDSTSIQWRRNHQRCSWQAPTSSGMFWSTKVRRLERGAWSGQMSRSALAAWSSQESGSPDARWWGEPVSRSTHASRAVSSGGTRRWASGPESRTWRSLGRTSTSVTRSTATGVWSFLTRRSNRTSSSPRSSCERESATG